MNEITGEMKNVEVEGIAIRGSNRVTSFIEWLVRHRLENRSWIEGKWVEKAGRRRRLRRLG